MRTVVGAVMIREGAALLLRRKATDFLGGQWEIPSGVVEPDEDHISALHREVLEETGLIITEVTRQLGSFEYQSKSGRRTTQLNFLAELSEGTPTLTEHDEFKWITIDELADSGTSREIAAIIRQGFAYA